MSLSSKITNLRSPPVSPSYPKHMWDFLKQGSEIVHINWLLQVTLNSVGAPGRTTSWRFAARSAWPKPMLGWQCACLSCLISRLPRTRRPSPSVHVWCTRTCKSRIGKSVRRAPLCDTALYRESDKSEQSAGLGWPSEQVQTYHRRAIAIMPYIF